MALVKNDFLNEEIAGEVASSAGVIGRLMLTWISLPTKSLAYKVLRIFLF
jgi:hypothetical protein